MISEALKAKTKEDVIDFIRQRLSFDDILDGHLRYVDMQTFKNEHRRFDMSGYEAETGKCTVNNMAILNLFADLGIYDFTCYLFLDFYKGTSTLYLKYFLESENLEFDLTGLGTTEIIYLIFQKTIFSDKPKRRRF
ncbi:MAG: hypothetical protein K1X49_10275 [Saprospiraceae bacterium]|nr:hypothetical protein [Saprospiraceae bacterium]